MPKAILFDLGDTVLKEMSYDIVAGYRSISKSLSPDASLEKLEAATALSQKGNSEFKLLEWINSNLGDSQQQTNAVNIELALWRRTVSLLPIPGIREVLEFLAAKNIRIAAISNAVFSSQCMRAELAKHNLGQYFEFVISSADYGIRKPDTKIFELALSKLGVKPQDAWYIGDQWEADVIGATSANMTAVWFKDASCDGVTNAEHIKLKNWADFEEVWQKYVQ